MANQMIALQARNPQLPDPARATTQMANMLNMASQQRAAQLQGERIRQEMDYAAAAEGRAVETQASAQKKAELEYVGLVADQFSRDVAKLKEGDIAGAEALRANIVREIPAWNNYIRPASEWTQDYRVQLMLKGKEIADKTIPDVVASKEYAAAGARDAEGNLIPEGTVIDTRIGGFEGAAGSNPLKARSEATPAPRATPTAPQSGPARTGKFGEALVVPDSARPLTADQQDHIRRMQEDLGMTDTPASFQRGGMGGVGAAQMTPDVMSNIVNSAFETGVMAQVDFDQLLASQPPQNKQALMDTFKRANITLQADAPSLAASAMDTNPVQTPQSQFAVMRGEPMQSQTAGLRGAPPMEQTLAQYIPVQRRDPNVSPYPGSAQVPIERVRAEGVAGRESPAEAAAKARATALATAEVEKEKKAAEKLPGRKQVSTIIKKIRGAYEQLEKQQAIASERRGGFANVVDYLATSTPGREVQKAFGTSASKYLSEITNSRKLLATAIKNATGMSAQEMNSNVELQLTLDALTDPTQGIEAARSTLNTLEELYGAPAPARAPRTPTSRLSAETRAKYGL